MRIFSCPFSVGFVVRLLKQNERLFIGPDKCLRKVVFLVKDQFKKVKTLVLVAAFYKLDSRFFVKLTLQVNSEQFMSR